MLCAKWRVYPIFFLLMPGQALFAATSFLAPPEFNTGVMASDVVSGGPTILMADVNGDGKPDAISAGLNNARLSNEIGVALGNGDGTFETPVITVAGPASSLYLVDAADFNGDGRLDLLLVRQNSAAASVEIWLGDGTGTFYPGERLPYDSGVIGAIGLGLDYSYGYAVAAADINRDGKLDIIIADSSDVRIFLGTGGGNFAGPMSTSVSGATQGAFLPFIRVADLNSDGYPDLLAVYPSAASIESGLTVALSFLGHGDGTFTEGPATTYNIGSGQLFGVAVADFNGDGIPDMAQGTGLSGFPSALFPNTQVAVFFGAGDGTFQAPTVYTIPAQAVFGGLTAAELDTRTVECPELLLVTYGAIWIMPNVSAGQFGTPFQVQAGTAVAFAVADVNGDGFEDIVAQNALSGTVLIGKGTDQFVQPIVSATEGFSLNTAAIADFNNDGNLDVVFANGALALGTPTPGLGSTVSIAPTDPALGFLLAVASGDFNGDGKQDVVFAYQTINGTSVLPPSTLAVLFGKGDGTFGSPVFYTADGAVNTLAVGDMNHDGYPDIVALTPDLNEISILLGSADGTFSAPITTTMPSAAGGFSLSFSAGAPLVLGDFNHDGLLDVATLQLNGAVLLPGTGTGSLGSPVFLTLSSESAGTQLPTALSLLLADIDDDGNPDVVVGFSPPFGAAVPFETNGLAIFSGRADGTFGPQHSLPLVPSVEGLIFTDVNGDNLPDLVGCNEAGDLGISLGSGSGSLQTPQRYSIGFCTQLFGGRLDAAAIGIGAIISRGYAVDFVLPSNQTAAPQVPRRFFGNLPSRHKQQ